MFDRWSRRLRRNEVRRTSRPRRRFQILEDRTLLTAEALPGLSIDPDVYDPTSMIVRFRDGYNASAQLTTIADIEQSFSLVSGLHQIRLHDGVTMQQALTAYRANPNVLYAEPDYQLHITVAPNDPLYPELWGLDNVGQTGGTLDADSDVPAAWDVTTGGSGTLVAVIDTGVDYTHEDLAANIWVNAGEIAGDGIDNDGNGFIDDLHGYDFANNDGDPMDDHRHGTHVAGTIGAVSNNGIGISGVNWNVQIMAIKFLDASGSGSTSDAVAAINYAVAQGAVISNNSWGGNEPYSQVLYDAIAAARDVGHIFVAGAGNGNALGIGQNNDVNPFYPANYDLDNIISVAATDHNDALAGFSNFGAVSVDLAAPGVNILSTTPGNNYEMMSGTSMATPHVTGVVSLLRELHPEWSYQQIIDQVLSTVDPIGAVAGITVTGGRLNAAAALGNPEPPPTPPPPGTLPLSENYNDGIADFFDVRSGSWDVNGNRYHVAPTVDNSEVSAISTVRLDSPLPTDLEIGVTVNADPEPTGVLRLFFGYSSNAFVVFDYHSETDFKFAGADAESDQWIIGQRTASGWEHLSVLAEDIAASTDYRLNVVIENETEVTLAVAGDTKLTYAFGDSLTDGSVGVGVRNSISRFDDVVVHEYVPPLPPIAVPLTEDFEDGAAEYFQTVSGSWVVENNRFLVAPTVTGDGVSTLRLQDPLPANLSLHSTINAVASSNGYYSNALLVFDYQSATDFKFAGAYAGGDKWVIGRRTAAGWTTDAFAAETIQSGQDYAAELVLAADGSIVLTVDGAVKLQHNYAESLTDGDVGLGTWNSLAEFDNVHVEEYVPLPPPPPPLSGTLPLSEDFSDEAAEYFDVVSGTWNVSSEQYEVAPTVGGDGLAVLRLDDTLPTDLELSARINAAASGGGYYSNALIVFDYHSETDFKFAGAYVGGNKWVIGHRTATSWVTDALFVETINAGQDYDVRVLIKPDGSVTLEADGSTKLSHSYADSLIDGDVGLGTWNSLAHFDNVVVREFVTPPPPPPPPAGTLPIDEDFSDGMADYFAVVDGTWSVVGGEYQATPTVGADALATLQLEESLPTDVELLATLSADAAAAGRYSNALVVFDYQSPTDFKFAGAYAGGNKWVIGHRTATSWVTDASFVETINAGQSYDVQIVLEASGTISLAVGGTAKLQHTYAGSLTDGSVGLGTWNSIAQFDNVIVQPHIAPPPPPAAMLPYSEDFSDGVADFFQSVSGGWTVDGAAYHVTPTIGGDGISTLDLAQALPGDVRLQATISADASSGGRYSNALVVFDYQSPTDFKFAGAYVGGNKWVIGRRTAFGWTVDSTAVETINAGQQYAIELDLQSNGTVSLSVGGVQKLTRSYSGNLTDGTLGLATWNAVAHFDDVVVQSLSSVSAIGSEGGAVVGQLLAGDQSDLFARTDPFGVPDQTLALLAATRLQVADVLPGQSGESKPQLTAADTELPRLTSIPSGYSEAGFPEDSGQEWLFAGFGEQFGDAF